MKNLKTMQEKEKQESIIDLTLAKKSKLIEAASKKKALIHDAFNKMNEEKKLLSGMKEEDKAKGEAKVKEAVLNWEKANSDFEAARIKASQYVELTEDENIEVKDGKSYLPKPNERTGFYHVQLDKPQYSSKTGKKKSKAFAQIYRPDALKQLLNQKDNLGYQVVILWDGVTYEKLK